MLSTQTELPHVCIHSSSVYDYSIIILSCFLMQALRAICWLVCFLQLWPLSDTNTISISCRLFTLERSAVGLVASTVVLLVQVRGSIHGRCSLQQLI